VLVVDEQPQPDAAGRPWTLSVAGFKAVRDIATLELRPLTVVAGANSSGKSSFMQPLLLLKQTLEADFDPGPLLLNGPNVKFTNHAQMFSRGLAKSDTTARFSIGLSNPDGESREVTYRAVSGQLRIEKEWCRQYGLAAELRENLKQPGLDKLRSTLAPLMKRFPSFDSLHRPEAPKNWQPRVFRNRCFLDCSALIQLGDQKVEKERFMWPLLRSNEFSAFARSLIHVPGLRGNPERAYPRSAVGATFPGTFEKYVASIVHLWVDEGGAKIARLAEDLRLLGLTWKVTSRRLDDASVEILVGRMPHGQRGGAHDLVSVADVGFGVSQTLPVVVSLLIAKPGQVVYLEQPEIHLHPKAQIALAGCLVRAAKRGVIVVAETHSSLLLRAIQTAVAQGELSPGDISMNWFGRDHDSGITNVETAEIDDFGRFGDWPVDFDEVAQNADWAYLDAVGSAEGLD
jgi:hypothetical protein